MSMIAQELKVPAIIGYDLVRQRYVYRETPTGIFFPVSVLRGGRLGALQSALDDIERETNARLGRNDLRLILQSSSPAIIEVLKPTPEPIRITKRELERLPLGTAIVGQRFLVSETITLGVDLASAETAHVLVAGMTGSGKSITMRTLLTSLMYSTPPDKLRIFAVDMKGRGLKFLNGMPHLQGQVVTAPDKVREVVQEVDGILEHRKEVDESSPIIVLAIDEIAEFHTQGLTDLMQNELVKIGRQGRELRIHLVASVHKPDSSTVGTDLLQQFGLRLVGRLRNARESTDVTGSSGSGAERLPGKGAMLFAKVGSDVVKFQAFMTSNEDVHLPLDRWGTLKSPVVLATKQRETSEREAEKPGEPTKFDANDDAELIRPIVEQWYDFKGKAMKRGGWSALARALGTEPGGSTDGRLRRALDVLSKEKQHGS